MKSINFYCLLLLVTPLYSQWENISIQTGYTFSSVSFVDDNTGYVIGGREIYKTANGGMDWELSFLADTFVQLEEVLVINDTLVLRKCS